MLLLPEAIEVWLPEGHLAHFISDTVDTLQRSAFMRATTGTARAGSSRAAGGNWSAPNVGNRDNLQARFVAMHWMTAMPPTRY